MLCSLFGGFLREQKMAERSTESVESLKKNLLSPTGTISPELPSEYVNNVFGFFSRVGTTSVLPDQCNAKDFCSEIINEVLKPLKTEPGNISFLLIAEPSILNYFLTIHGGVVASVAESVSIACARSVFPEDKEIFLGELSISYLSGAPKNEEVIVEAKVVRKGRNVTVVAGEFRLKKTQKLIYQTRATFYNLPAAKL